MAVRRKHIRTLAHKLLNNQNIVSAPVPVDEIALALGIRVQYEPAENGLSGFILKNLSSQSTLIGINNKHPQKRQRFTLAHELGHYLLHEKEELHVDRQFQVKFRDEESSKGEHEDEREANLFAAELLMPVHFIQEYLSKFDALDLEDDPFIDEMAKNYDVSTQAMTFRLAYLGYIRA